MTPQKIFHDNIEDQAKRLSEEIAAILNNASNPVLILPGGSSPRMLISELAQKDIDWSKVQISITDERSVPIEDEESNAGQIQRLFANQNVNIQTNKMGDVNFPATVTVLGMGPDGHIASLFPGQKLRDSEQRIFNVVAPKDPPERTSFSMEALLETENLLLLVNGAEKWALCERILGGEHQDLPLAVLMHMAGDRLKLHIVKE